MSTHRNRGPFPWRVHPVWNGIGCLLIVLIPVISLSLAEFLLTWLVSNNPDLEKTLMANTSLINNPVVVKAVFALVISIVFYLVFSIFGSLLYSLLGGPKNAELAERTRPRTYR